MNLDEAFKVLELEKTATPEERKKKFRKLAAKYHPDVNKDPQAETKFKEVNAANEFIENYRERPPQGNFNGPGGFGDVFQHIWHEESRRGPSPAPPVVIPVTISFKEAVLGCQHKLNFKRNEACASCEGHGERPTSAACDACKGNKVFTQTRGNMVIQMPCGTCQASGKKMEECPTCKGKCVKEAEKSFVIQLPCGLSDNQNIRLSQAGHFSGFGYADAFLKISVQPEPGMTLQGQNIRSEVTISLLEALEGKEVTVKTIKGEEKITIPPESKHKDIVELNGLGVPPQGKHLIKINVTYPDKQKLIEFLKGI